MNPSHKPEIHPTHAQWYAAHLQSLSIDPGRHLLYSYSLAFQGFAASLHPDHLPILRSSPAVLHLHPDPLLRLHTTHSPEFLGLLQPLNLGPSSAPPPNGSSLLQAAEAATKDVIIGVLDTGVWPESRSFDDAGIPEIPRRWRAPARPARQAQGVRFSSRPRRPWNPHLLHGGGLAGGERQPPGLRSGHRPRMATAARVAMYKVCWASGCFGSDILAGMDRAIADGVDVLSLSLGGGAAPYFHDTIAIGAFSAMERGIFVSCSAGNSGPMKGSLANTAPWILTVGAGTLDRDFPAVAALGSGASYAGVSLYSGPGMGSRMAPLVYDPPASSAGGKAAGNGSSGNLCLPGTLSPAKVRGKVVLCDRGVNARVEKGAVVKAAGGVGMILANAAANGEELVADSHLLPAVAVGLKNGDLIRKYAQFDRNPKVLLQFQGTVLNVRPSPVVAAFSSRGPNGVTPQILKPDVIGPGVNILAAWSGSVGPTGLSKDRRRSQFNIMSGTSMSCPHVSGIAALVKAAHPEWSPAAVKSALMTTAYTVDNAGSPLRDAAGGGGADPYGYGSGHVDPRRALSPGLVYDIAANDYVAFLCSLKYSLRQVQAITKRSNFTCSRRFRDPGDLNYPSFSIVFNSESRKAAVTYTRELTNVGEAASEYAVEVTAPASIAVTVKPSKLLFTRVGQKLRYSVSFSPVKVRSPEAPSFGWVTWKSGRHQVRSPVAVSWNKKVR
ncbi:unnamed protein product [Spirodela intermedia]|uniref:Uncharacterized protein n=1 Tax=Spirodela intermedia TaxID=51605 RepID=A0A7I8J5H0_SPIIN|nr:unnamed protein product [Spirodela intermedia]CAA6664642.1 unnamed protein product [Spirodela intermedia]